MADTNDIIGTSSESSADAAGGSTGNDQVTTNAERPTSEWVTGDEPATGPQESYLHTLAREAGEEPKDGLTKAQASDEIERLQGETNRG